VIEIPVDVPGGRYCISVGHGLAVALPELFPNWRGARIVVVSSPRIWALHGRAVGGALRGMGRVQPVMIPEGESRKTLSTLKGLYDAFLEGGLARDGLVVALGGGVVGDVAGMAAATYMRGVNLLQLPTTLLAMVDSAIGGKVGVNHPWAKNLIGAFHQPRGVVVDPLFLRTLPAREVRSGLYEVVKCGIIGDADLFAALGRLSPDPSGWSRVELEGAIASACRLKAEVVEKDEREGGLRRVLNLGHTLGHAFEAATSYRRFAHGEAVGWGLLGAALISRRRGLLPGGPFEAIHQAVERLGPRPPVSDIPPRRVLDALSKDKKKREGKVPFILPRGIGRVTIKSDVSRGEILGALRALRLAE
jgi:3-dehydroquinate synthase